MSAFARFGMSSSSGDWMHRKSQREGVHSKTDHANAVILLGHVLVKRALGLGQLLQGKEYRLASDVRYVERECSCQESLSLQTGIDRPVPFLRKF